MYNIKFVPVAERTTKRQKSGACEVHPGSDCTAAEVEFLMAMDRYKRDYARPFPTWREVMGVFLRLGYARQEKVIENEPIPQAA